MTTPSGQISLDDVNVELDISPGTQINMNAAPVRALAEVPTGAIAMSDLQGKSNAQFVTASGGTETTSGDFKIHTFNSSGTFTVNSAGNPAGSTTVDFLVVAGGGGGGGAYICGSSGTSGSGTGGTGGGAPGGQSPGSTSSENGSSASANTGGGGGGASSTGPSPGPRSGGAGGSGIVIIRYKFQ
jgi:hypothetical protein